MIKDFAYTCFFYEYFITTSHCTWTVRGLTVGGFLPRPLAVSPSMGWCRLCAAPCPSLQAKTSTGERAGAPGAPGGQAAIDRAVLQGTVPPAVVTATAGKRREETLL